MEIRNQILKNVDIIVKNIIDNNDIMIKKSSKNTIKILCYEVKNITK